MYLILQYCIPLQRVYNTTVLYDTVLPTLSTIVLYNTTVLYMFNTIVLYSLQYYSINK